MSETSLNKDILTDHLRSFFGGVMFHRGKEYFDQGLVKSIRIMHTSSLEKIQIEAPVQGTNLYQSSIKFNLRTGQFSHSRCSCPYDWTTCKHAAALGLAFIHDAQQLVNAEIIEDITLLKIHAASEKQPLVQSVHTNKEVFVLPNVISDHLAITDTDPHKTLFEKYYLVIGTRYSLSIDIYFNKTASWNHWPIAPEVILQSEKHRLSIAQKKLFSFLRTASFKESASDLGTLFTLLQTSCLPLYLNKKSKGNLLSFNTSPQKIAAKLFTKTSANSHFSESSPQTNFVFAFKEPLYAESFVYSFFGKCHIIIIRVQTHIIEIHPVSQAIASLASGITQKIRDNAHLYADVYDKDSNDQWKITLDEQHVITLNQFLIDTHKVLNLETTLLPSFTIKQSSVAKQLISVAYDNENHTLAICALIDYGFAKVDVSRALYKSMQGGSTHFKRNRIEGRQNYHIAFDGDTIHYAPVAHTLEAHLFQRLHTDARYGFTKKIKCLRTGSRNISIYHTQHWPHIQNLRYPIEYTRHQFDFFEEQFKANVRVDMDANNDWLTFDVDVYCGENRVTLDDLKKYIHNKEDFIRMNNGRLMKISNLEDLERFVLMLESFHQKEDAKFEGRAYHAPELENIFTNSPYYNTKFEKSFQKFMTEAQSGKPVEKISMPKAIQKTLRTYQKEGVRWMHFLRKYRFAGILADDMGLGKTIQALTLLEMHRKDTPPSIVICPKTLLFNWEQETEKFFPTIKTLIIEGSPKERAEKIQHMADFDLIITSYPSIKKDFAIYEKMGQRFHYCFIDEAQFMKNHKTQNAQIVKKIPADYRLALTGTPLENNVSEIWSIFDFLMPGFLGSYATFVKKFQTPIMKNNDARVLDELRKKVSCFMLRRTKEKVLTELPPKVEQTLFCELEEAQNVLYQEILANVKSNIFQTIKEKGFAKSHIHILAGLTKLRQVCNHPALLLKDKDFGQYESAKLKIFEELIEEIVSSDRKVLVFSQFTKMLDILQEVLRKKNIEHLYLFGKTKNRKELVQTFNEDANKKVFLISLKAGGTGLNLTAADNVIIFDPWWNPSVENQAVDRAHRMGQTKSVNVYRLVTKGTIEEKILRLQEKKQFLFDNLVNDSKDLFQKLTWGDIKELFL
jgi:superfamily II DNA or RNA helicase